MPKEIVLDSSILIAVLLYEPGNDRMAPLLENALVSTVNIAEVHSRLLRHGTTPEQAWAQIHGLQCRLCSYTEEQARVTGELTPVTRPYGLSLGDRACLALATERKAKVYTTDRVWANLSLGIEIEVIR